MSKVLCRTGGHRFQIETVHSDLTCYACGSDDLDLDDPTSDLTREAAGVPVDGYPSGAWAHPDPTAAVRNSLTHMPDPLYGFGLSGSGWTKGYDAGMAAFKSTGLLEPGPTEESLTYQAGWAAGQRDADGVGMASKRPMTGPRSIFVEPSAAPSGSMVNRVVSKIREDHPDAEDEWVQRVAERVVAVVGEDE